MRATTERSRGPNRPDGWLQERVLEEQRAIATPLTVDALTHRIKAHDDRVLVSAVFRAVKRLMENGRIDRVELLAAYVQRRAADCVVVICRDCRSYCEVAGRGSLDRLEAAAHSCGFRPSRYVVEVPGLCAACTAGDP